jgi:hypothetical protein
MHEFDARLARDCRIVNAKFWGVHPPRVLAIAPSRSRTFFEKNFGELSEGRTGLAFTRRGVCAPKK